MPKHSTGLGETLERLSERVTRWTGGTSAFVSAVSIIALWGLLGPIFHFSNTWQLVVNTGTTVVTFLMVFLIQRSQNKDALAIHLKLNELVAAMHGASNRLIDVETLTEAELRTLQRYYGELTKLARTEIDISKTHSVEEARNRHGQKLGPRREKPALGLES